MKKYFLYITVALLALTSCDESQYELQNLVPGQYHKVMVVKDSGKHNKTLYDTGDADTTNISVMKVGSDPSLTAHVDVRTLTDEELRTQYSELEGVNTRHCHPIAITLPIRHLIMLLLIGIKPVK